MHVEFKEWDAPIRPYDQPYQYVARATVYKKGCTHPFVMEVYEEEYTTGRDLWVTKRRTMTRKVALCQALRAAFSISDLYDPAEKAMEQPDVVEEEAREVTAPPPPRCAASYGASRPTRRSAGTQSRPPGAGDAAGHGRLPA